MRARLWLAVLATLVAAAAAVAQGPPAPTYLAKAETECWRCHNVPVGGAPAIGEFAVVLPPAAVEAAVGQAFDYTVEVQNAWSGEITYVEPGLDLAGAPSLGFVADVPPLRLDLEDVIPVQPARPTGNHSRTVPVGLADGLTYLRIAVEPADNDPLAGPDLVLRVKAGRTELVRDAAGRGAAEDLVVDGRQGFAGLGYGEWQVTAEVTPVPVDPADPLALANASLAARDVPFRLVVEGEARDLPDRALRLPLRVSLPAGQALTATFRLVAGQAPSGVEEARATLQGHIHYKHQPQSAAVDDADFLAPGTAIQVGPAPGGGVLLSASAIALPPAVHNGATMATVAESVGYASGFLMVSSTWAGGMFGKASRRQLNAVFGSAKRRVAFHNFLSYGLILAALAHAALFFVEATYGWTVGLLWGGTAVLAMLGLGMTGALQVPMIRKWSFGTWRWSHWGLAIGAALLAIAHVALDGVHFGDLQEALGWRDPLTPVID